MPFIDDPNLIAPKDPDCTIWRYMDITKFLSLIDKSKLFFVRIDQLTKDDAYEGFFSDFNVQFGNKDSDLHKQLDKLRVELIEKVESTKIKMMQEESKSSEEAEEWGEKELDNFDKQRSNIYLSNKWIPNDMKKFHDKVFVNSWHIQEHESAAMWKLYAGNASGIAIESSYNRLKKSLKTCNEYQVNIGTVKYMDYRRNYIPVHYPLSVFLHKRKSFEHEKELRALVMANTSMDSNEYKNVFGIEVSIVLDELINRIFVSPTAEPWILQLLQSVIKRYKLDKEIVQSDLISKPIY